MRLFFESRNVVVVGVSDSPFNLGRAIVMNLLEFQFNGIIHLVGPKGGSFLGHKIYPSVDDVPGEADLAVLLVPAAAVPDVMRQCGRKGIRRVVVESAGFRELGSHREVLEEEIQTILRDYEMRMIGPNCLGIMNRRNGLCVPFMPFKAESRLGRTAVIAQSGGVGAMMLNALAAENIGFSRFASIGNKLDVNENDLISFFMYDEETDVIFCYLEGIADGRKLMELAYNSQKPIIIHKANNGKTGELIARSHSASLSGDDEVVEAAFRQCGIIRTREKNETMEAIKSFCLPPMKGERLGVISRSGGHAVMAADAAEEYRLILPPFPEYVVEMVREKSRAKVINFHNPLDLGDLFDLPLYSQLADMTLAREDIDGLVFVHNYQGVVDAEESRRLVESMGDLMAKHDKPIAVCIFTTHDELQHNRRCVNFPIFDDPRVAVRALARTIERRKKKLCGFPKEPPADLKRALVRENIDSMKPGSMPVAEMAEILEAYGINLAPWEVASDQQSVLSAAKRLGFPLALKTAEPEVVHKSDAGGVILGVRDEGELRTAIQRLARFGDRILVQKMAEPGVEWFIGGRQDKNFGSVVVTGLGGIYVEIFKETSIRVGPLGAEDAHRMLDECKSSGLLKGMRGQEPLDTGALVDQLVRISWLLADFPEIKELDLNPVRVFKSGCQALDWRAVKAV